ncbi:beta-N-acetylglucosaminidase [Clostridium botulinum H04402 065]|uniref:N-acetylmuramoyl-L-alanine amidase n=1 Tax=Clostridium botulinum TaxID=1491 RepID=UPI0001F84A1C|nr:N-acetylmuramoyl-L-alanine amidase [Clostridium botulinum]CBZ04993.1 beta-N-acetylglucosaminidase [Clostridium botulinum H04402 065]
MKNKKYYLVPKIISIFFMLFLFSIQAQAVSNISINLKTPTNQSIINSSELNIDGEIKSILKLKSVYLYIDNEKIGQANLGELEFKENTYKTRLNYTKDISSLKNGIHNLRILAIDEQNNKEEKEISINIQENQEKSETDKNIIQNNLVDTNAKMGSIEKVLATVSNEAKLEKVEVSYNGNVITNGEIGAGKSYVIKGYGNSENGVLYQFWVKDLSTNSWTMIRDYGETNSFNYTPTKAGKYLIGIHVKDKYSKENLDDFIYENYTVTVSKAKLEKVEVSYNGNVITNGEIGVGKSYVIKGYGNSENGVLYQFWVKDLSTNSWTMIRDYGETNSFNYTPTKAGKYLIGIHVKDKYSKENLDDFIYENYTVTVSKAKLEKVEVSYDGNVITNGEIGVGKSYVIKGYGNSENGVLYQFWVKDLSTNSWTMIKDYGEENSINWKPTVGGKYLVGIHVKDKYSIDTLDDHIYENYTILSDNARLEKVEVKLDGNLISNNLNVGKTYTIEGSATSKNGVLYQFWVKDLSINSWAMLRDYGESNNITYTPTKSGQYLIGVHVKDKNSKESLDDFKYNQYSIIGYNKTVIVDAGHGGYDSGAVGPTGIKEKDVTLKVALKLGKILENSGVNVIYTRTSDNVSWPSNESQDLAARVAIANNNNTDLYVSIHANSFNGSANGTETYYYDGSAKGKETAEKVQKELVNSIGLYDRGVKTAGYYVLKNTISPSILVELGFIDNRNEEILLNSDWFQQKCAEAIAKGILSTSFM